MEDVNQTTLGLNETLNVTTQFVPSGRCGQMDDEYVRVWSQTQWWCEGTLFTGVGVAGFVANVLSVGILSTKEMRKHTFNQLLIALCICDVMFILVSVPVYAFQLFQIFVDNQVKPFVHTVWLVNHASWSTVQTKLNVNNNDD